MSCLNSFTSKKKTLPATLLFLVFLLTLLSSCYTVTSLYPLTESNDRAVFREELIGTWEDNDTYCIVQAGEDSQYLITVINKNRDTSSWIDTSHFIGRLAEVDGYLFFDCSANMDSVSCKSFGMHAATTFALTHFVYHIVLRNKNEVMELWKLKNSGIAEVFTQRNIAFYEEEDDDIILLEPSARLKKLLVQLLREQHDVWERTILIKSPATAPVLARNKPG